MKFLSKDTILLSAIKLKTLSESELDIVPVKAREELEKVRAEQIQRLNASDTARVIEVLDRSTGSLGNNEIGLYTFGGVVKHPDQGLIMVQGRGKQIGEHVNADGKFVTKTGDILFQIQNHEAGLGEAEGEYFKLVENASWEEATQITTSFEEVIRARVRELRDNGKPVMYTTDPEVVKGIIVAPLLPRAVGRMGMQIGAKVARLTVGELGVVQKKLDPMQKIKGLISG